MSGGSRGSVVRSIQTLFDAGTVAGMTDGQLLDQFLERQGPAAEPAFAALVKLHGPMVWGVCRGALADVHDAEDAFQATFLVLVRKAGTVRRRDTLGPWLYGVARRVAVRAKAGAARRRQREVAGEIDEMTAIPPPDPLRKEDLDILHEELDRLPEKYRAVVVLCHLEGRTQAEAARLLNCPIGTIGVRVTRARDILRDRLTRRGFALPAALAGAALLPSTTMASAVPAALTATTIKAALQVAAGKSLAVGGVSAAVSHLTQGVLKAMTITKKVAVAIACILAVGIVSTGAVWVAMDEGAAQVQKPVVQAKAQPPQDDLNTLGIGGDNLRNIALAMYDLAAVEKITNPRYPEATISKNGKPLLSWRVAILPFLDGCKPLYDKFHLDEAWDSPHNKTLLKEMPEVYAPVVDKAASHFSTYYQVFVGPGALFERVEGRKPEPAFIIPDPSLGPILVGGRGTEFGDVRDGTDHTILVVEAATPVPWTKPEDLTFNKDQPLPKLGAQLSEGFRVAFASGAVAFLSKKIDPQLLRAMITRSGGERFAIEQLRPQ